ncbi:MAG TPA: hypothetical protein VIL48_07095 [Acidimicrobiales bacterium]
MALRDKLRDRMQPFLEPGEQVQHAFIVQTGPSPYWMLLTSLVMFTTKWYVVAVTDRAIVVARAPWWMASKPKQVVARLPRNTQLGPVSGLWAGPLYLTPDGKKSWVHKRFHKDVEAADAALHASGTPAAYNAQQQPMA